jgi:putative DNA primase/helicase
MNATAKREAAEYRRRGWSPIPIKRRSKHPNLNELEPYLYRAATAEELSSWAWSGVGIVTGPLSGVLVLDVDGPEGEAELKKHGHPVTPMARTASGGMHLYFRHPEQPVRTGIRVAPGLDVKASGGYVVAPPSIGENGKPYEWIVRPEEVDLAEPPRWLMDLLERERPKGPAGAVGERIPPGERNKVLASLAGTMRRRGMGEGEIFAALQVANQQRCQPPLELQEVEKIAASVARYEPADNVVHISANGHGAARPPGGYNLTDLGNAERFVRDHGEGVRYCYPWGKWLVWAGDRWRRDDSGRVHRLAKESVRRIYREASDAEDEGRRKALAKHAAASESEARIRAMLELSKSELPVSPDELDADPWLFNTPNGTVDLRSGTLRAHRREDLLTKMAGTEYRPDAAAPEWAAFLERVLPGEDLRAFVQRAAGYSTTGDSSEQCMFIDHGSGANGKSTFQEALAAALGDYAMRAPTEMLMAKRAGGVPNDVARLKGARFVAASETEEGRRLAESLVKDLTGQDTISARFMRAEWFDFKPTHKLWLSTNHKPEIRGTDPAIWRRIRLVPWGVAIPPAEQDRKLLEKLRGELPGVLAWIVRGCLEWQREGLKAPDDVRRATAAYRTEMDVLGAFLQECCIVDPDSNVAARDLYAAYKLWCQENGERAETQRRFGARLTERGGFERYRGGKSGGHRWRGLELLTLWESAICRDSDPSDPQIHINAGEIKSRGDMHKKGSEGSEGSANPTVADVQALISRKGTGPGRAYSHYLGMPSDQRLEYLVKAVLHAKKIDSSEWERYRSIVLEASAMEDA